MRCPTAISMGTVGLAIMGVLAGPAVASNLDGEGVNQVSSSATGPRAENFQLALHRVSETEVDVAAAGFGPGDYAVRRHSIHKDGKRFGRLSQICHVMTAEPTPSLHCSIDLVLPGGQVSAQGSFTLPVDAPRFAVTGGTNGYQGVYGQLTETGSEGDVIFVTLHLTFPE